LGINFQINNQEKSCLIEFMLFDYSEDSNYNPSEDIPSVVARISEGLKGLRSANYAN
jgi:hypothetical protein